MQSSLHFDYTQPTLSRTAYCRQSRGCLLPKTTMMRLLRAQYCCHLSGGTRLLARVLQEQLFDEVGLAAF